MMSEHSLLWMTKQYRLPERKYHDLTHIAQIFDMARACELNLSEDQIYAIWYHDCIEVPGSHTNVEDSAAKAYLHIANELDEPEQGKRIKQIILDTKEHVATTEESKAVIDLDLSILGAARSSYITYSQLIRKEYQTVPWLLYAEGRAGTMKRLLERIESGDLFYILNDILRGPAIENIKWELGILESTNEDKSIKHVLQGMDG